MYIGLASSSRSIYATTPFRTTNFRTLTLATPTSSCGSPGPGSQNAAPARPFRLK
ncbi:MAG: hypothetical protein VB124_05640 [Burkholderia sp.]